MVGNQRRLPLRDVLAYKADNRAKRRKVLEEMAALDQELELYDGGVASFGVPGRRRLRPCYTNSEDFQPPSWPGLSRPSTPPGRRFARRKSAHSQPLPEEWKQLRRVDGRDKPGHDGGQHFRQLV